MLKNSSVTNSVIITSVRKSEISDRLKFGKQYVVESADEHEIKIDYEHEGNGNLQIPENVTTYLFQLRSVLINKKLAIEHELKDLCHKYVIATSSFFHALYNCTITVFFADTLLEARMFLKFHAWHVERKNQRLNWKIQVM